jgi:probable selenium-dependent hydroxylase accessory protein YqeC
VFSELFGFELPATVNFVGGGGKTALILTLGDEYSTWLPVVYTTTVRIHPPAPTARRTLLATDDTVLLAGLLERIARDAGQPPRTIVATRLAIGPGLLGGVPRDFARGLDPSLLPVVLNEADGARSVSLKAPRAGEPVLMEEADYLVPVIGLDCLGRRLGPETLFRWELARQRWGLREGEMVTPQLAAAILLHPEGVCRDWRPGMRLLPFINKVDTQADEPVARALAAALLQSERFPVERVVWGSVEHGRAGVLP